MAVIYLRHPRHGSKVACSDMEATYDIGNGWERYEPAKVDDEPRLPQLDHDGDGNPGGSLSGEQSTRRRGRPSKVKNDDGE